MSKWGYKIKWIDIIFQLLFPHPGPWCTTTTDLWANFSLLLFYFSSHATSSRSSSRLERRKRGKMKESRKSLIGQSCERGTPTQTVRLILSWSRRVETNYVWMPCALENQHAHNFQPIDLPHYFLTFTPQHSQRASEQEAFRVSRRLILNIHLRPTDVALI